MTNRVVVVGLGHVGLPLAAVCAQSGYHGVGVDTDIRKVEAINGGDIISSEPGLEELVSQMVQRGRLRAVSDPPAGDVFVIAVPTPICSKKRADLTHLWNAADSILHRLNAGALVIVESTVPVGTTERLGQWIDRKRPELAGIQSVQN